MIVKIVVSCMLVMLGASMASCHNAGGDGLTRPRQNRPGPQFFQTKGEPWPKPQLYNNYGNTSMRVRPALFRFKVVRFTCDILEAALKRYYSIIVNTNSAPIVPFAFKLEDNTNKKKGFKDPNRCLDVLTIDLMQPCESYPHDDMHEAYEIKIDTPDLPGEGMLVAASIWGMLRGLETFSQLLHHNDDFTALTIKSTLIVDYPRFPFRSVLLDTSRHYLSKKVLFENLDLMAMNKYNVFHWHIVDDQSFPYQSRAFPKLSFKGAYQPYTHVYTQQDVAEVIEYARYRGIRVLPEFDTPGHTQAWGPGNPGFLTPCYDASKKPDNTFGPVDPTRPENFAFLKTFFQEVATVFPDKYLHLGGDEVDYTCWKSNPNISQFMSLMNYTEYNKLEEYYMQKLIDIIQTFPQNNSYLVWQEVVDNGVKVDKNTIVHVWKREKIQEDLAHVTSLGYRTLLSSCWYLNYISYGIDWPKYYTCDPHNFNGTDAQKRLVFGGGAALWGEYADSTNLIARLWPRAAVPAERLWSSADVNNTNEAAKRLEEHRCRLLKRGFMVQPANGPGFCSVTWD